MRRRVVASLLAGPAALAAAVITLASACSYDWTVGDPFRGVPGTDGATSPSGGDDAGVRPGAKVCAQGETCACPSGTAGGNCQLDCPVGQCTFDCTGAASCSMTCNAQCTVDCADAGTCDLVTCVRGQCDMTCPSSTSCTISSCAAQCGCDGPGCR